jgi:hypothetical protein
LPVSLLVSPHCGPGTWVALTARPGRWVAAVPTTSTLHRQAKDKNDPFKLMGFGHPRLQNRDPRYVMKQTCDEVLKELGISTIHRNWPWPYVWKDRLTDHYFKNATCTRR